MASSSVKLYFNFNTLGFGASISVPSSLKELLESLPDGAASLLDWMPDIVLEELGVAFTAQPPSFGVFADAGIAGSAHPAAQAFLSTVKSPTTNETAIVVGLALTTPVDFTSVPVIGTLMSGVSLDDLAVVYASADIPAGIVFLPPPAPKKEPAFKKGLGLVLTLESGGAKKSFSLSPSNAKSKTLARLNADGEAPEGGAPVQWFDVQKQLGPLTLGRIGLATSGDWLGIGLDASLALTGLAIELIGFTAGFPKDNISLDGLELSLDGLSVYFQSGAVLLLGNLVRSVNSGITSYNGTLSIQAGGYGIAAIGSFAQIEGAISMFVFGAIQGVFGGPPAFVVTGIAAGFGYNRSLKLPGAEDVLDFPLVLVATLGKSYLPDPKDVSAMLGKLDAAGVVPPSLGSYWFAAGVQFSSFQLLSTFAMLSVEVGKDLVIALLGVSSLSLPKGAGANPLAFAEMTLSAVLRPYEGSFKMMALLTPRSFVLDPNCRLTGGFAFYLWFGSNAHSGDFVVTLGGYNPYFVPEEWYPKVPRLGFAWTLSSELRASGATYFALTPSCVMAGGALDVRFDAGALKAWFTAHADFIMWWKPFYFIADIGVSIGASYTVDFGVTTKTFSIELSCGLLLFGPPIAGIAHVKWFVISFDVPINGGGQPNPPGRTIKDWSAFAETYLPPSGNLKLDTLNSPVARPSVTRGLLAELDDAQGSMWLVNAANLSFGTETMVPATRAVIAAPEVEDERRFEGPGTGVYPLGSVKLESTHTFRLRAAKTLELIDLGNWTFTPILQNAPDSMWGLENNGTPAVAADVMPALLGLSAAPSPPVLTGPPPAPLAFLAFSNLEKRELPLPDIPPIDGSTPPPELDPRTAIEDTVARADTIETRAAYVAVMNAAGIGRDLIGGEMTLLAEEVRYTFEAAPMLGPLGSTGPKKSGGRVSKLVRVDRTPIAASQRAAIAASDPAPAGSRRPRALRKRASRGAAARLRALYRRRASGRCEAVLADGFTTRAERLQLSIEQGHTALMSGTVAVFDVPEASGLVLELEGALLVEALAFDRQDQIVAVARIGGAQDRWVLPSSAARVVVSAKRPCTEDQLIGWTRTSTLLLVAPQVLLAEQVAIRAQSAVRLPHGRTTRARGVITGRAFAAQNRTLGVEVEAGWTETLLPAGLKSAIAVLARDEGAAGSPADTELSITPLGADRVQRRALRPARAFFDGGEVVLVYSLPAETTELRALLRPPIGYRHEGLLASRRHARALDAGNLDARPPVLPENLSDRTEVRFR